MFAFLAGSIGGLVLGALAGLYLGAKARGRARRFWLLNAACFLIGFALTFAGQLFVQGWLAVGGVALIAGGLTGLRYGYGEPMGPWRTLDRVAGINQDPMPDDEE